MGTSIKELGKHIKSQRETNNLTQEKLAETISVKNVASSTVTKIISGLENGKLPDDIQYVKKICEKINLPKSLWEHYLNVEYVQRIEFEELLEKLYGEKIYTDELDITNISVIEDKIKRLFSAPRLTAEQYFDCLNSILVFYNILPLSKYFFNKYFKVSSFSTISVFKQTIKKIQQNAIRLFSSINDAYLKLNSYNETDFDIALKPVEERNIEYYSQRTEWNRITRIEDKYLPYLGYVAVERMRAEKKERKEFADFLLEIADKKANGSLNIAKDYTERKIRKMSTLRTKFESKLQYGFFDNLFNPSEEELRQEAAYINPERQEDFDAIEKTQNQAYHNLSNYLAADYMDVYVATSMREDSDFISVNSFVENLFKNSEVEQLKLRYFNPTQSWIADRVAKGIVEALMLNRADICIYMAQKTDTFGKDSEASVTLGQGKSVIVYVPQLFDAILKLDSENIGKKKRSDLLEMLMAKDIDPDENEAQLQARYIKQILQTATEEDYIRIIKKHWADFGIVEAFRNSKDTTIEKWLKEILSENASTTKFTDKMRSVLEDYLVTQTMFFEKRAKLFREQHPLALQIIRNSGVLNGILVVRSIDACAKLIKSIIENKLELDVEDDNDNYKLIEKNTLSTIRVISKHKLIANAFNTFYKKKD